MEIRLDVRVLAVLAYHGDDIPLRARISWMLEAIFS